MRCHILPFAILLAFVSGVVSLGCLDENGKSVDWWVSLKLPLLPKTDPIVSTGMAYSYADSNSPSLRYMSGKKLNNGPSGSLGSTMNQIWQSKGRNSTAYAMYNDESPDGKQWDSAGHLKGVFAFDSQLGFWIIHSAPRYPDLNQPYNFPSYAAGNGQSFLCLTLPKSQFEFVAQQLLLTIPHFYQMEFPAFTSSLPSIGLLAKGKWNPKALNSTRSFVTKGGNQFLHFARSRISQEIYQGYVSNWFNSGLLVESWMNGQDSNMMPSFCKPKYKYNNRNVREVQLGGFKFPETKDHSKWTITTDNAGWVCIGDMNRQFSQQKRGGGTMCLRNNSLWSSFNSAVSQADKCP